MHGPDRSDKRGGLGKGLLYRALSSDAKQLESWGRGVLGDGLCQEPPGLAGQASSSKGEGVGGRGCERMVPE